VVLIDLDNGDNVAEFRCLIIYDLGMSTDELIKDIVYIYIFINSRDFLKRTLYSHIFSPSNKCII